MQTKKLSLQKFDNLKIILFLPFIFFFDLGFRDINILNFKIPFLDFRILFLALFPLMIFEIFQKKEKKRILFYIFILLIIYLHFILNSNIYNFEISNYEYLKFFLSLSFIVLTLHNLEFFRENILKLIEYFLIMYTILNLIVFFLILNQDIYCLFGCYSKSRLIFKEASHLTYIAPFILFFYLLKIDFKKLNLLKKLVIIFFLVSIFLNLSTTLLITLLLTSICFLLFYFKLLNYKQVIYFVSIFLISLTLSLFHKSTYSKFFYIYNFSDRFLPSGQNVFKKKESTLDYEKLQKEIKKKKNYTQPI